MVAGIKSERWPTSNRNPRPDCLGIRTKELNLETLVWTRGRKMLLSDLKDRVMCPQCGGRRISIIFDPKPSVRAQAV
jgi:hypothetical protein